MTRALDTIADLASPHFLAPFGHCAVQPSDGLGSARTLVLLGPAEPGFWAHVTSQPEFSDTAPDPLDRWSLRVISAIAAKVSGQVLMPFGGPPWRPFIGWAKRSGRAWASPVSLLVHDSAGLMVSYRGAISLPHTLPQPAPQQAPCVTCTDQPCRSACPADALTPRSYDIDTCHSYLDTDAGQDCMTRGCAVRRACPISARYGRTDAQSAWHMRSFHK